jgi:manganese oxidase
VREETTQTHADGNPSRLHKRADRSAGQRRIVDYSFQNGIFVNPIYRVALLRRRYSTLLAVAFVPIFASAQLPAERIVSNDNRAASGKLANGGLTLSLEIRDGRWYPESDSGATVPVYAFAETGKPPSTPGPLIRVPEGTEITITIRNRLEGKATRIYGLHTRPRSEDDGVLVPANGSATVRFRAGVPGTYYYWGTTGEHSLGDRSAEESQLSGAMVIDPASNHNSAPDRVFVLGLWNEEPTKVNGIEKPGREVLVINGKSWPHTERFNFTAGDTVKWRWVNPTASTHPMHLHGFYYSVTSRGAMSADTVYAKGERRLVNTELMRIGSTMAMTWVPTKPGNWVFHCHFAFHVSEDAALEPPVHPVTDGEHSHGDVPHKMAGLVLGIHVAPRDGERYAQSDMPRRNLRLLLQQSPKRFGAEPAYGFVLQSGSNIPRLDSVAMPGPALLLKRGEPVRITVVNNLTEPSSIHWHGIELESFPDGVPNWSGMGSRLMAPIAPKDSFMAEFTPPRSGTFMYHSHLNEGKQINSGMYGALVVMDDPAKFDPTVDKIILVGGGGPSIDGADTRGFVNGSATPDPLRLTVGTKYRLRLINIHPEWRVEFALGSDTAVVRWRPVAKDGADLPASQAVMQPAYLLTGPGETADFEYTPWLPGYMRFTVRTRVSGWNVPMDVFIAPPKRTAVH